MAKKEDLTDRTNASLVNGLADAKRELFNLRFQLATGQLENNARIKEVRKEVARLKTEIRSREIAAAEALEPVAAGSSTTVSSGSEGES